MKKVFKSLFCLFSASLIFSACDKEAELSAVGSGQEDLTGLIKVKTRVSVNEDATKVVYDQGNDESGATKFFPNWSNGTTMSFMVPIRDTDNDQAKKNTNRKFEVVEADGATANLEGELFSWHDDALSDEENERTLFAVYPYNEDLRLEGDDVIVYKSQEQVIDAVASQTAMTNGLLVASVSGVTSKDDEIKVPTLFMRQAMSFLRFTIRGVKKNETIVGVSVRSEEDSFIDEVKIQMLQEAPYFHYDELSYSNTVSAEITNYQGGDLLVNLAIVPVDLVGKPLTICVHTEDALGYEYEYTRALSNGINFKRNLFSFFGAPQDLGVEFPDATKFELSDFVNKDGGPRLLDKWIITDSELGEGFDDFKTIINEESRNNISLVFENVETVQDEAFIRLNNIGSVSMPKATNIGNKVFYRCRNLTFVSLPMLEVAGEETFNGKLNNNNPVKNYPNILFEVSTKVNKALQFGADGYVIQSNKKPASYVLKRVTLKIKNNSDYLFGTFVPKQGDPMPYVAFPGTDNLPQVFAEILDENGQP